MCGGAPPTTHPATPHAIPDSHVIPTRSPHDPHAIPRSPRDPHDIPTRSPHDPHVTPTISLHDPGTIPTESFGKHRRQGGGIHHPSGQAPGLWNPPPQRSGAKCPREQGAVSVARHPPRLHPPHPLPGLSNPRHPRRLDSGNLYTVVGSTRRLPRTGI